MITPTGAGWAHFELCGFHGSPSYLTDVPIDVMEALTTRLEKGTAVAVSFDEEGSEFTLVISGWSIFIIEEKDTVNLHECDIELNGLIKEVIQDVETNIEKWTDFLIDAETDRGRNKVRVLNSLLKLKNAARKRGIL